MTCSWRWFIHPETAISKKRNGSSTLCVFKTHYRDRRATVANHLIFMQIQFSDHTGWVPEYVNYCLCSPEAQAQMQQIAGGAAQPKLDIYKVLDVEIPCHPEGVQERIATIFSAYDDLIENNTRRITILEEMAQMLYREWFINFRFPGHETVRLVESELGLIPDSCRVVELGEVIDFENGKAAANTSEGAFPLYGSNGIIGRVAVPRYESAVVIGRVGAYCGSTMFCRTRFWASGNTIVAKPVSEESLCVEAAYQVPKELNLRRYAGGSAQPLLTQAVLRRLQTVLPDKDTNRTLRELLQPLQDFIIALDSKNASINYSKSQIQVTGQNFSLLALPQKSLLLTPNSPCCCSQTSK